MASYNFTKTEIQKPPAFDAYLRENFPLYEDFSYTDPNLTIDTTQTLTETELTILTTLVNDYVDPTEFLVLNTTIVNSSWSKAATLPTLTSVHTFIFTPKSPDGTAVFDGMKTIFEYTTSDITAFSGVTGAVATFQIYDYTRSTPISTNNLDISDIVTDWNTQATGGATGSNTVYRSFIAQGLRHQIANYDCIWQFRISVSVPNISVRTHSIQKLYYDVL